MPARNPLCSQNRWASWLETCVSPSKRQLPPRLLVLLGEPELPVTHHPSPVTHHPSPITRHPSPVTHHPSPVTQSYSVGLLNSPPSFTSAHGGSCASTLKLKCPAAAHVSRNMRC